MTRAVSLEKSEVNGVGEFGIFHYAVKVAKDDWYEVSGKNGGFSSSSSSRSNSSSSSGSGRNAINGKFDGYPNRKRVRKISGELTLAGATDKTDSEIVSFNKKWLEANPYYDPVFDNCQKYASDLIHFLVGASCKMGLPLSALNKWANGPGSHEVDQNGIYQARATTGKAGAQFEILAAEAEGPCAGADVSEFYAGAEASLGRVEAQVLGVGARVEPNVNTGIGVTDGQFKAKAAGFGFTVGTPGFGIHTPLGSLGFGTF